MPITPYLFFDGKCEEALEFYKKALGAKVAMIMRFGEAPDKPPPGMVPPNWDNKIMHATFHVGDAEVMASDGSGRDGQGFKGFSLSLTAPTEAMAKKYFAALSEGGQVRLPISKTFWSPCFGMVADRFGVGWMVTVPMQQSAAAKSAPAAKAKKTAKG